MNLFFVPSSWSYWHHRGSKFEPSGKVNTFGEGFWGNLYDCLFVCVWKFVSHKKERVWSGKATKESSPKPKIYSINKQVEVRLLANLLLSCVFSNAFSNCVLIDPSSGSLCHFWVFFFFVFAFIFLIQTLNLLNHFSFPTLYVISHLSFSSPVFFCLSLRSLPCGISPFSILKK